MSLCFRFFIMEFKVIEKLKKIVENPYINLIAGLILIISSGKEIIEKLDEGVGAHHGVFIFGLLQALKSIPEIVEALDRMSKLKK